jgi:hypothetical protein
MYTCTSGRCACGKPITFRTINGRKTPIHLK